MDIADTIAERLGGKFFGKGAGGYKFARIKRQKAEALRLHPERVLIDLGVGEPDRPAHPDIVKVLAEEAGKHENRIYADNGILEYQMAAGAFLQRMYGVHVDDPHQDILHCLGSKSALAMLPACFIHPGDIALMTVPGYPVMGTWTRYLGGEVVPLPLTRENGFLPDLDSIPADVLRRVKMLYLNYPNNPTGQTATRAFYRDVVAWADRHHVAVVSDAAYSALTMDGEPPLSFLSIDGASEVGVEVHSMSKSFNMTGWRLGFVAGNRTIISALGTVKDNTDSGQFRAIQKAGAYALQHPEHIVENVARYSRRFDGLVGVLRRVGLEAAKPKGTFYAYVPAFRAAMDGRTFATAEACADYLLEQAGISVVPWDDAGAYLRFSVTFEAEDEQAEVFVFAELERRLMGLKLTM